MSGVTNYPTAVDDGTSLGDATDNVTTIPASHHNNPREAIIALEKKVGVYNSSEPTAIDTRLGHPTLGHNHNGASGQGQLLATAAVASAVGDRPHFIQWQYQGSIPSGASLGAPFSFGKTMQLLSLSANVRRAPSGATLALDVNFGPTSVYVASQGYRPIWPAATTGYANASPNLVTYASGTRIVIDADVVGTNEPGTDLSIIFVFKE